MDKAWIYLDTSTYLKLYVKEKGYDKARRLVKKSTVLSSAILPVECFSALSRKKHSGEMDESIFNELARRIKNDLQFVEIIRLSDEILTKAGSIVLNSTARALDALHIASALVFEELSGVNIDFITPDIRQAEIAKHCGLTTLLVR
jgi:predicted nucleic acid-binding protein